jgi:hypothetical protein
VWPPLAEHSALSLASVDCHSVGMYTVIVLSLLSLSTKMIVVRKPPSWPRSWANFSLYSCVPTEMHWANLHLLGQPNTFLARRLVAVEKHPAETQARAIYAKWLVLVQHGQGGGEVEQGSVALPLCATAHPLHTGFTKIIGASISDTTMRLNPKVEALGICLCERMSKAGLTLRGRE